MKTAIKLILIYFLMQILGALTAGPLSILYVYVTTGGLDVALAQSFSLAPALLLGIVYMTLFLWKAKYLSDDGYLYALTGVPCLLWCLLAGVSAMFLTDVAVSYLTFLPDWMEQTFDVLQSGWLGILCVAVLGPVLEELLFRGAVTKVLLQKYSPTVAILLSGLLFGLFHINPAQVVSASLIGFLLAWLYWRTRSVVPGILIHILNNGVSVYLSLNYPEVENFKDLVGTEALIAGIIGAVVVLGLSLRQLQKWNFANKTITE